MHLMPISNKKARDIYFGADQNASAGLYYQALRMVKPNKVCPEVMVSAFRDDSDTVFFTRKQPMVFDSTVLMDKGAAMLDGLTYQLDNAGIREYDKVRVTIEVIIP